MNLFLKIFLAVCFIPVLLIQYFILRNEGKPKNNLILSTTLPKEVWEDERVLAIRKRFYRNLDLACLILLLLYLPAFFTDYMSIQITYVLIWMDCILIVPNIPYCKCVRQMRELKKQNWYHPELKKVQVADTSLSSVYEEKQNTYTFVNFLLPLLVSMIPLLYPLVVPTEGTPTALFIIVLCNAGTILMMYVCYCFAFRKKSDRVSSDVTLTSVLTRIRRYYWGKFWLYMSWSCALFSFSTLLLYRFQTAYLVVMTIFMVVIFALALGIELKIRHEQQRLNKEQPSEILVDEDDYWLWGCLYYNKNDSNLMVNNRVGFGTSVNAAHPVGMGLCMFCLVLILLLPFTGIWMAKVEFTDPYVVLTDTAIEAYHVSKEYTVPLEGITDVAYLKELPETTKNVGTNFAHIYKGNFSVEGIDPHAKLCLDPYDNGFLVIRAGGTAYIFSMEETEALEEIFRKLADEISN